MLLKIPALREFRLREQSTHSDPTFCLLSNKLNTTSSDGKHANISINIPYIPTHEFKYIRSKLQSDHQNSIPIHVLLQAIIITPAWKQSRDHSISSQ